jgi:WD40 repeat protein
MGSILRKPAYLLFTFTVHRYAVTGSKDGTIVKWDLQTLKTIFTIHSRPKKQKHNTTAASSKNTTTPTLTTDTKPQNKEHSGGILSLAINSSGKYLFLIQPNGIT